MKHSAWKQIALVGAVVIAGIAIVSMTRSSDSAQVEVDEKSRYSHIRIRRKGNIRTLLFVRDGGQEAVESQMNMESPQELMLPYSRAMFASYLFQPEPRRVLIVGLGGGSMVHFLRYHQPDLEIDAVEIDPVVVRLADQYFGTRPSALVRIFTADGFDYLANTDARYDVIYMDAFLKPTSADGSAIPQNLRTTSFYQSIQSKLSPGGLVVINMTLHSDIDTDMKAVAAAFARTTSFRCSTRNRIVVGLTTTGEEPTSLLKQRAGELDSRFQANFKFQDLLKARRD